MRLATYRLAATVGGVMTVISPLTRIGWFPFFALLNIAIQRGEVYSNGARHVTLLVNDRVQLTTCGQYVEIGADDRQPFEIDFNSEWLALARQVVNWRNAMKDWDEQEREIV